MQQPLLAITLGDPAGVGPETIVGAWTHAPLHSWCRMVAIGQPAIVRRAVALLHSPVKVVDVSRPDEVASSPALLPCLPCGSTEACDVPPAQLDARGGQAAYDALVCAARLALAGQVSGLVTAPLNKAALHAAGHHYPGHTELLGELCGVPEVAMMLYLGHGENVRGRAGLGVAHVTLHVALREALAQLSMAGIVSKARLAHVVMQALLGDAASTAPPRIGVAALNPHAGEKGLFGDEEIRLIAPAVAQGRRAGLLLEGPLPCDTLMVRAAAGEFDAVVAMYHDQGHIALKLLGMHRAVNITLGLPIVRTSVAHGTAFDLAWQGRAETSSMVEAIRVAALLARSKAQLTW